MAGDGQEIRIGVYVCHCGLNIAQTVDCAEVAQYAAALPDVVIAKENMYSCADPGQNQIKDDIVEYGLNRVVVAACSVKMHGPTFMNVCCEAGLNPYLFEMVNIREHCSWVHMRDKQGATAKAKDQVKMAVGKVHFARPLEDRLVPMTQAGLVIGGGVSGLQAALDMANAGHPVYLVEKAPYLGGRATQLERVFDRSERTSCLVNPVIMRVLNHPKIRVFTSTEIEDISGYIGSFKASLRIHPRFVTEDCDACGACCEACPIKVPDEFQSCQAERSAIYLPHTDCLPYRYCIDPESCNRCGECVGSCPQKAIDLEMPERAETIEIGTIVLAVGSKPYQPPPDNPWGYDGKGDVLTSLELERFLDGNGPTRGKPVRRSDGKLPGRLAFIQCVGSREPEGNGWCSRICCMNTIKEAVELKKRYPVMKISVYHNDIRAYKKEHEEMYRQARASGVIFLRGRVEGVERQDGGFRVLAADEVLGRMTVQDVDMVVLATGMVPSDDAQKFQNMLKVPTSADGFMLEAHPKLKPLETAIDGVMLAGSCQFPKDVGDCMLQASGAAAKCMGLLCKEEIELDAIISHIDQEKCNGCLVCVKSCPFSAIVTDEVEIEGKKKKRARVIAASCKGCGVCAARCKQDAVEAQGFTDEEIYAQIDAALEENPEGKVLALVCHW